MHLDEPAARPPRRRPTPPRGEPVRGAPVEMPPPLPPRMPRQPQQPVVPIPEPCFEPSVIDTTPKPPPQAARPAEPQLPEQRDLSIAPAVQGKVLVMFNCRGGAGATSIAVNTAHALVRRRKSVCIVDLDMQLGDVFVALDLKPETSIAALAREASTIDAAALRRRLARHDSGIFALTQIGHIDDVDPSLVERIPALISTLTDHFDYVLIDGVRDFGDYALSVLDMADEIAMVLAQDVASVRRAARAITLFRRLGYSDSKLKVILNRWTRKAQVSNDEIARALRLSVSAKIRNDYKRVHGALNQGALIANVAPGSGVAKDFAHLALVLGGMDVRADALIHTAPVSKVSSWFGFLKKGGK